MQFGESVGCFLVSEFWLSILDHQYISKICTRLCFMLLTSCYVCFVLYSYLFDSFVIFFCVLSLAQVNCLIESQSITWKNACAAYYDKNTYHMSCAHTSCQLQCIILYAFGFLHTLFLFCCRYFNKSQIFQVYGKLHIAFTNISPYI